MTGLYNDKATMMEIEEEIDPIEIEMHEWALVIKQNCSWRMNR